MHPMDVSLAQIENGVQLSYIDSGPPSISPYTTLVCVHGHTYTAQNFTKTLSLASKKGLRVIAVNRRDYASSTRFSEQELAVIKSRDDASHTDFLRARGLEIAQFLSHLVKEKGLSMVGEDESGGIALLGWSLGNIVTVAFLRHFPSYPTDLQDTLRPYLKHFFIYEAGTDALGYPSPDGAYHPLRDDNLPKRTRGLEFGTWVSSYYKHPAYASSLSSSSNTSIDISNPKTTPIPTVAHTLENLTVRTPRGSDIYKPSTLERLTPKELLSSIDARAGDRSEQPFWESVSSSTLYANTRGALFPSSPLPSFQDAELTPAPAPALELGSVRVTVMYGRASIWSVQWAAWKVEEDLDRWDDDDDGERLGLGLGHRRRSVTFRALDEGNHFLHWEDPNMFLDNITGALSL